MSGREVKNVVVSILARLRNHAESIGASFQHVLQQYAIERFLYRISKSKHAESVVLKGALLLKQSAYRLRVQQLTSICYAGARRIRRL